MQIVLKSHYFYHLILHHTVKMAESIHNGINDSLNNLNLNSRIERFHESNSLKDNLLTFKKINSKKYDIIIGPLINSSVIQLEKNTKYQAKDFIIKF